MEEKQEKTSRCKFLTAIKDIHNNLEEPFRIYWYVAVFIFLTVYVIVNRCVVADFTFFTEFDGMNLLFIIWVIMLLLPCLGNFEISGFKYGKLGRKMSDITKKAASANDKDKLKAEFEKMMGGGKNEE